MLLRRLLSSYWYIGLFLYSLIAVIGTRDDESLLFLATALVPFVLYGISAKKAIEWDDDMLTPTNLFVLSLLGSLLVVFWNHQLSLYIDGDQFLFSKTDALVYIDLANKLADNNIENWLQILKETGYGIDDWGAFLYMGAIFTIAKSQTLFAIANCIIGSFSALNLFYIGRSIMCRRYAFITALSFSLASYILIWQGVFLKETMLIFIIIGAFRCYYSYINTHQVCYIVLAYIISILIFMFRTPVALLAIMSFSFSLVLRYVNKTLLPVVFILMFVILTTSSTFLYSYDRYMAGGDVERIVDRKNSLAMGGGFVNQITDPLAAFIGPFPSVVKGKNNLSILNSSGLIFRLLIVFPFILGAYYIVRYRQQNLYPLIFFFVVNAIGVAVCVKGLEVRLSVPHLFCAYLIAFAWMSQHDNRRIYFQIPERLVSIFIISVVAICILWNVRSLI